MSLEKAIQANTEAVLKLTELLAGLNLGTAPASEEAPAPENKKATKKQAEKPEPEKPEPEKPEPEKQETAPEETPEPEAQEPESADEAPAEITYQETASKVIELSKTKGRAAAEELLAKYDAKKLTEVDPALFAQVIQDVEELLA